MCNLHFNLLDSSHSCVRKTGGKEKSPVEKKERADTERQTDMKQIRRISEELGETEVEQQVGRIVNHVKV